MAPTDRHCPECKERIDAATCMSNPFDVTTVMLPRKDDVTLCVYCGAFLMFDKVEGEERWLRTLTEQEVADLPDDERITLQRLRKVCSENDFRKLRAEKIEAEKFHVLAKTHLEAVATRVKAHVAETFGEDYETILIVKKKDCDMQVLSTSKMSGISILHAFRNAAFQLHEIVEGRSKEKDL